MAEPTWDIAGGPGVKPEKPNRADYEPGGKWYGLLAWSVVQKHYEMALEAHRLGFWYHGNWNYMTSAQAEFNQRYVKKGGDTGAYGVKTGTPGTGTDAQPRGWHYEFVNGEWKQISDKPDSTAPGSGGGGSQPDPAFSPAAGLAAGTPSAEWLENWYTSGDRFKDTQSSSQQQQVPASSQAPTPGVTSSQSQQSQRPLGGTSTTGTGPARLNAPNSDAYRSTLGGAMRSSEKKKGGGNQQPPWGQSGWQEHYPDGMLGPTQQGGGSGWQMPSWMPGQHEPGNWQDWYTNNPWSTGNNGGGSGGGSGSGSGPGNGNDSGGGLGANQGAFDAMMALLNQYNLGSLADVLKNLILDGITDQASIMLALQQTPEWKQRFAGNEALAQQGLPMLSVGEYLAVERSYAQILKNHGLPSGFYDDPADFAKWIGASVSANELNQRAQVFSDIAMREDPAIVEQLKSMGMSAGDILAYTMDPSRAMPLIQKKYQTTLLGAAARRQGVIGDNEYLGHLSDIGVTEQQAIQGYGVIGENLKTLDTLGDIHGEDYDQRDFETEVFEQDGQSAKKRKRLASRERAAFSGESGVGQGSLTRRTGGSY